MALKQKFPKFKRLRFVDIVNEGLKGHEDMQKLANSIRNSGNEAMHKPHDKVVQFLNEFMAKSVLQNLKSLLEFLYK